VTPADISADVVDDDVDGDRGQLRGAHEVLGDARLHGYADLGRARAPGERDVDLEREAPSVSVTRTPRCRRGPSVSSATPLTSSAASAAYEARTSCEITAPPSMRRV
jgi:hypothetical protein